MMNIDILREWLFWCGAINFGCLMFTSLAILFAHDLIYSIHSKFLKLSVETFDTLIFASMGFYKICIFVFFIIPYAALRIVTG